MDTSQTVFIIKYESISAHVNRYPSISHPAPAPAPDHSTRHGCIFTGPGSPLARKNKLEVRGHLVEAEASCVPAPPLPKHLSHAQRFRPEIRHPRLVVGPAPSPIPQTVKIPQENRRETKSKTQAFPAIYYSLSIKQHKHIKGVKPWAVKKKSHPVEFRSGNWKPDERKKRTKRKNAERKEDRRFGASSWSWDRSRKDPRRRKRYGPVVDTVNPVRKTIQNRLSVTGPVSGTDSVDVVSNLHAEILEIPVKRRGQSHKRTDTGSPR